MGFVDFVKGTGTALSVRPSPTRSGRPSWQNHVRMLDIPVEQLKIA